MSGRKTPTLHEDIAMLTLWRGMHMERIAERIATYDLGKHTQRMDARLSHARCMHCKTVFFIADARSIGRLFCSSECSKVFYDDGQLLLQQAMRRAERAIIRAMCGLDPAKDDLRHKDCLWDLPKESAKIA